MIAGAELLLVPSLPGARGSPHQGSDSLPSMSQAARWPEPAPTRGVVLGKTTGMLCEGGRETTPCFA